MNSSKFRFTLDLHSLQSQYTIPVMIGDTSVTLLISITDGGIPYVISDGCLAKLSIKRPTGTYIEEFCKIKNNAIIEYPFSQNENTCAVRGIHFCDVTIYGPDGGKVGGPRFTMSVNENVVEGKDVVLSDENKTAVDQIIMDEVDRKIAEEGRVKAEKARVEAEVKREEATGKAIERAEEAAKKAEDAANNAGGSGGSGGSGGGAGKDGVTFIPDVSPKGVISWTNDGGLDNPEPVNIKGGDGKNAYEYAQDGGFAGTEMEFSAKLAKKIPEKTSELKNDSEYIKASEAPVQKVNDKTGNVTLDASDVGARPDTWMPNASEVGARPATWTPTASDVGARPDTWTPTYGDVGADKSGTAASAVSTHNTNNAAHNDIRLLIEGLTARINAIANSTDEDLDQMAEIVAYIKANKTLIDSITTSKVSVADIVDNLTTNVKDKPLSAAQGVALKTLIDAITVPTKVSELENDAKYLTSFTEADPTVPFWAKQTNKPSYSKSEVGLGNVDNVKQYSASNPPPYPVTSVNGETGAVTLDAAAVGARPSTWTPSASEVGALPASTTIPTKTSQLTNDSNFAVTTKAKPLTFELEDGSTVTIKVVLA